MEKIRQGVTHLRAGMATFPPRQASFRQAAASIACQVDELHVYLNGYAAYLRDLPGNVIQHKGTDIGDAGKFVGALGFEGVYLSCDDDLIYPPGYVDMMLAGMKRHPGCLVTLHGKNPRLEHLPAASYYQTPAYHFKCLRDVTEDVPVLVPGSGVSAFDAARLDLREEHFPTGYMADLHLATIAARRGVECVVLRHRADTLRHIDHEDQIFKRYVGNDAVQTALYNALCLEVCV